MKLKNLIKEYGIEDISKKTKITTSKLILLEQEDYESLSRTQTIGFISIIEREYKVSLEEYKNKAIDTFNKTSDSIQYIESENREEEYINEDGIFKKFKKYIIILTIFIAIYILYTNTNIGNILQNNFNKTENLEVIMENNVTDSLLENEIKIVNDSISIISITDTTQVTFINLDTREYLKKEITSLNEFIFKNNNSQWIITSEYGYLKIVYNSDIFEGDSDDKTFFFFDNNRFEKISKEEFDKINKDQE